MIFLSREWFDVPIDVIPLYDMDSKCVSSPNECGPINRSRSFLKVSASLCIEKVKICFGRIGQKHLILRRYQEEKFNFWTFQSKYLDPFGILYRVVPHTFDPRPVYLWIGDLEPREAAFKEAFGHGNVIRVHDFDAISFKSTSYNASIVEAIAIAICYLLPGNVIIPTDFLCCLLFLVYYVCSTPRYTLTIITWMLDCVRLPTIWQRHQ